LVHSAGIGAGRVSLAIGGFRLEVLPETDELQIFLDVAHRAFIDSEGDADIRLRARWGDLSSPRVLEQIFDSSQVWRAFRDDGAWVFDFFSSLCGSVPYKSAHMNDDFSEGEIVLHAPFFDSRAPADVLQFPLGELLVMNRLSRMGGVEFHACGVADRRGRGVLFAGQSGDGKTTTARLWSGLEGATILSDDRIIVRRDLTSPRLGSLATPLQFGEGPGAGPEPEDRGASAFRMYGTPWHGEGQFAAKLDAPIAAVFVLEHGAKNEVIPISGADAMTALFSRAFPPFYDRGAVESVLATIEDLVHSVPCFRFPFVPDVTATEVAESAIEHLAS
jgi:hypothetical protein